MVYYARINSGETLPFFNAMGPLYIISGSGETSCGDEISWGESDVFLMQERKTTSAAGSEPAILWIATNEPQLAFENAHEMVT